MFEKLIYTYLKLKYKNKKTVIYGAGKVCCEYFEKYDLKNWNILAIADKKYSNGAKDAFFGLETTAPANIYTYNPEVIFIALKHSSIAKNYLKEYFPKEIKKTKIIDMQPYTLSKLIVKFYSILYKNKCYTGYSSFDEDV